MDPKTPSSPPFRNPFSGPIPPEITSALPKPARIVPEILRAGAETYAERNAIYGDNYKRIGALMVALFPEGIPRMDPDGWNRFLVWLAIFQKTVRYAVTIERSEPGHEDSAHDAMVYAAMLEELTKG